MTFEEIIGNLFAEFGSLSAAEVTKLLRERDALPPYWTVIDVADFLKEWFSEDSR